MLASKIGLLKSASPAPTPPDTLTVDITTNQTHYNLFTAAGSPVDPKTVNVTISTGVIINANNPSIPAFNEGDGWAAGTTISIVNNGTIWGMGGAGGNGGAQTATSGSPNDPSPGANGVAGGPAIRMTAPTLIANAAGLIQGGGGGGGGGGGYNALGDDGDSGVAVGSGGGGGGGGAGYTGSTGGSGGTVSGFTDPSTAGGSGISGGSAAGGNGGAGGSVSFYWYYPRIITGSRGGRGGDPGEAGNPGQAASITDAISMAVEAGALGLGGAAGPSVVTNGFSLTWISGNGPDRLKGPVI